MICERNYDSSMIVMRLEFLIPVLLKLFPFNYTRFSRLPSSPSFRNCGGNLLFCRSSLKDVRVKPPFQRNLKFYVIYAIKEKE